MPFEPIAFPAARVVEKLAARRDRDMQRGRRAQQRALQAGASAMDAAIAAVRTTFDEQHKINALKLTVEWAINRGTGDPLVRARYRKRAQMLHLCNIDKSIGRVERWFRDARHAQQVAMAMGAGSRLEVEILSELKLILRFLRRSSYREHYPAILALFIDRPAHLNAAQRSTAPHIALHHNSPFHSATQRNATLLYAPPCGAPQRNSSTQED